MATLSDVANITVSKNRDETINGNIMFNGWVNSNHQNANSVFYGYNGSDYSLVGWKRGGSGIEIFGSESANCARWLRLRSSDDSTYWSDLDVRQDGVYFNWQPIIRLVESGQSGQIYYRVYSDGFIEQWGHTSKGTITFPKQFKDNTYSIVSVGVGTSSNGTGTNVSWVSSCCNIASKSATGFVRNDPGYGVPANQSWYACGY